MAVVIDGLFWTISISGRLSLLMALSLLRQRRNRARAVI